MTGLPATQPDNSRATAHAPAQVASWPPDVPAPALAGNLAWARVIRQALCTEGSLDADEWFPVSSGAQEARREAAAAIAICQACPVRSQCLALSLRHWDIGQHGVWGGMVTAERANLRRQMLAHRADALRYFTDAAGLRSLSGLCDTRTSSRLSRRCPSLNWDLHAISSGSRCPAGQSVPRMRRIAAADSSALGRNPVAGLSAIRSA